MPLRADILTDHPMAVVDDFQNGKSVLEVYECFVADDSGVAVNSGTIDVAQALALLPATGTAHPIGALCTTRYVMNRVAPWSLIMGVRYRSGGLFSGGPRRLSRAFGTRQYVPIPVWESFLSDGLTWYDEGKPLMYPRPVIIRIETRFLSGNQTTTVQTAISVNAGKFFAIDGLLYRLSDHTQVSYDGRAYTRADYAFEYPCELRAMTAVELGSAVPVPFLPAHYEYRSKLNASFVPIVTATPPPAENGGPPTYVPLPGFP